MKLKHLPILILLATISFSVSGQKIPVPNSSFEDWDSTITPPAPQGWSTCDPLYNALGGQTKCVTASQDHYTGKLSMMVTSDTLSFTGQPTLFPGFAITQFPTTLRNNYFSGFYKGLTNTGDTQLVVVMFSRYNPTSMKSDTIGVAFYLFNTSTAWTQFITPINYKNSLNPDSVSIEVFSNTHRGANTLSFLKLDDIGFVNNLGVNNVSSNQNAFDIYPNPASGSFKISFLANSTQKAEMNLYDLSGRLISRLFSGDVHDGIQMIPVDCSAVPAGTYIVKMQTAEGSYTGKLFIVK